MPNINYTITAVNGDNQSMCAEVEITYFCVHTNQNVTFTLSIPASQPASKQYVLDAIAARVQQAVKLRQLTVKADLDTEVDIAKTVAEI